MLTPSPPPLPPSSHTGLWTSVFQSSEPRNSCEEGVQLFRWYCCHGNIVSKILSSPSLSVSAPYLHHYPLPHCLLFLSSCSASTSFYPFSSYSLTLFPLVHVPITLLFSLLVFISPFLPSLPPFLFSSQSCGFPSRCGGEKRRDDWSLTRNMCYQ